MSLQQIGVDISNMRKRDGGANTGSNGTIRKVFLPQHDQVYLLNFSKIKT